MAKGQPNKGISISTRRQPRGVDGQSKNVNNMPQGLHFTQKAPASVSKKGSLMAKGKIMGGMTKVSSKPAKIVRGLGLKSGGSGKKNDNKSGGFKANAKTDINIRGNKLARQSARVPTPMVTKGDKGGSVKGASSVTNKNHAGIRSTRIAKKSLAKGLGAHTGGLGSKGRQIKR